MSERISETNRHKNNVVEPFSFLCISYIDFARVFIVSKIEFTSFVSCSLKIITRPISTTINYPVPQGSKERKALAQILQCISNIYLRALFEPKKFY